MMGDAADMLQEAEEAREIAHEMGWCEEGCWQCEQERRKESQNPTIDELPELPDETD